jgi:hypothetical protein
VEGKYSYFQANFKTLVNKNAIKPEKGYPQAFFPESLDPARDFGKKHQDF